MNRSQRNNNPGNLRYAGQTESTGKDDAGFAIFPTPMAGWRAMHRQIAKDQNRGLTLAQFINKYAPSNENNTKAYLDFMVKNLCTDKDTPLEDLSRFAVCGVIAAMEGYYNKD